MAALHLPASAAPGHDVDARAAVRGQGSAAGARRSGRTGHLLRSAGQIRRGVFWLADGCGAVVSGVGHMSETVVTDLLITRRREEDATGRLAELEEQFVQQLDETERYKQEVQVLQQLVACFKQECDAKGIKPNFPPSLEAHAQRLYAHAGLPQAQASNARPKDGCEATCHPWSLELVAPHSYLR